MDSFKGTLLSGEVRGPWLSSGATIKHYIISNKSNSLVVFNVFITTPKGNVLICPKDMQIKANESFTDSDLVILNGENILIKSNGEIDYFFSIA